MFIELQGELERITYANEENNFTIARVRVQGHRDLVTVLGYLVGVTPGEILKLQGSWVRHKEYGEQFKIDKYETVTPATERGIKKYLGSGLIKGIGPIMAHRLVDRFGSETLDVIENSIGRLQEVNGIGKKRIQMIGQAWQSQKEIRNVMVFLQDKGVSSTYATKIYKQYGQDSIQVVQQNPYRLATDIFGIGFKTADNIAAKLGIPKDSQIRAEAGLLYVLNQKADDGHVYYPYEPLIDACEKELTESKRDIIISAFAKIEKDKHIVIEDLNQAEDLVANNKAVYLKRFHVSETGIAKNLKTLARAEGPSKTFNDTESALDLAEKETQMRLSENQRLAVLQSMISKVLVITGGPGVGKTTVINAIIKVYKKAGYRVLLAAPTGRAAKRMSEATGVKAKTIHRLLEFSPKNGAFTRKEDNPLDGDLIVIDETSMVDTILMHHLLKAVPLHARLILVGDVDQLPSVGAGSVLKDIIESGFIPAVKLTEIFRQAKSSMIITNAHKINKGEFPYIRSDPERRSDFYFFEAEDPEDVFNKVIELCKEKIPKIFAFDPVDEIQVITPMHRGIIGASNLNVELQKHLNQSTDELLRGGRLFKTGDKVMQIRNNYDKEVYNGDIGRILSINREDQEVSILFDERLVTYDYSELDEIVLAYAISVHKSQGSEYPAVIIPVHTQHYMMLQR
ncbi:MAG TPA: ATP-dependent RecD-like DNA helicase, partial [Thermodesulfovibrionia bacterium]|nr:ATP-dependent RecD-like DNA helicase [Thermodesulfovibrionia bacterium]